MQQEPEPVDVDEWSCPDVELQWARLARALRRVLALRRLWSHLGVHLRRFSALRLPSSHR